MKPSTYQHVLPALLIAWSVVNAGVASAQFGPIVSGPGGPPGGPVTHFDVFPGPLATEFVFGSPSNRAVVQYATGAGSFEKWLRVEPDPNQDGVTDVGDLLHLANQPLSLYEFLTVGPGPDWTDWHERIVTPGWDWISASLQTPNLPGGPTGLVTVSSGAQVDFYFDPLSPGTDVDIQKDLLFTGDPSSFSQQFFDNWGRGEFRIRIAEYPTSETVPEPAAAAACLAGLAGLLTRRRAR